MRRVLIVDDDPDLLEMVCLMVSSSDMKPLCVSSGDQAIQAISREHFDLIVMDIYLGQHDGRELARQLKADPKFAAIPILLYSAGHISPDSIYRSKADGFIQKPFEMPDLLSRMRSMMAV